MRQRIFIFLGMAATATIGLFFAACGGDSSTGDGGSDAASDNTIGNDTGTGNDTGAGSDAGSDVNVGDGCASLGTTAACTTCCNTTYADAAAQLAALVVDCACGTDGGGACASQCASTLCQGSQPNGPCNSCINQGGQGSCNSKANAACTDAGCAAVIDCVASCP